MDAPTLIHLLEESANRHSVPGAVLGILRQGRTTVVAAGMADTESREPVTGATRFGVGSITKPVAATLMLRLEQAGYLAIDDPVSNHLPALATNRWAAQASIRDLLANRSRIPLQAAWEFGLAGDDKEALTTAVEMLVPHERAADCWSYSNLGWVVLGSIVETVTGLAWEDAAARFVLDPFGMRETVFASDPGNEPRATGHVLGPDGPRPVPAWTPRAYCASGSSLLSTVPDLLGFASHHLHDPLLARMRETHASVSIHGWLDGWGLGWARFDWTGTTCWGWDGVLPGQRAVIRLLPEHDMAVAIASNGDHGRAMAREVMSRLVAEVGVGIPPLRLDPGTPCDLGLYEGVYAWPDRRYRVTAQDDHLIIEVDDRRRVGVPVGDGIFRVTPGDPDNPTVTFSGFDDRGRPQVMYVMLWGLPRVEPS